MINGGAGIGRDGRRGWEENEMTVKPIGLAELKSAQQAEDSIAVNALTEKCNKALKERFGEDSDSVWVSPGSDANARVRKVVMDAFRAAGWDVQASDDQRDGTLLVFKERSGK
jgi:hypothetical protein